MTEQMFAARNLIGRRGFSSASAHCGLGRQRTYAASIRHPVRNRYGTHNFSSRSLVNLGGDRRISYGGYGARSYGGFSYSPAGYGSLGFSGRLAHCGPRIGSGGLFGGYSNSRGDGIQGVRINENLLKPLHVGVDPEEQEIRNREREDMKNLNDQFACFIDKVQSLEQQNKVLETKWNLLQEYARPARKNLEPYYENFIILMKNQIDCLLNEREQLENEDAAIQHLVEEFKCKYEEEFKQRTTAENEFVLLKKDVDSISLSKEGLQGKADLLRRELEFREHVYAEEFAQLGGQVCDAKILLQMDNSRVMDADLIIRNVEAWYQNIVHKTKEEVNALYENRFEELQLQRGKHSDILKINQQAVTQLVRLIHKLQSENDVVKRQVNALETDICDVEQRGDHALKDARKKHINLQAALKKAKDDLAGLLKDYHEVLNVKLALDIEIATYRTMLEGEEIRIHTGNPASIDVVRPLYLDNLVGDGPVGVGYNSGYGGYPRNCNRRSSSRSVGEPSRTVDNSNVTTRPGSSDAGVYPGAAPYSRSCPVGNRGADSSSQGGGAGVGKDGSQGLGFSSGTVQGSINNVSRGYVPGGIEQNCPSGGYLSGGYRPANIVPAQAGGFGPRVGGTPIVVDSNPGVAGGIGVGNIGGPAGGIPVAVGYGGLGGRPCVETGAPVGICYPGVQRVPGGVYYPGQVGVPGGIFYTEAVAMM